MEIRKTSTLSRRKLNDAILESFLVGNTRARALLSKETRRVVGEVRLLWLAAGDLRNVLKTVAEINGSCASLHLRVNDSSVNVTTRNVLMLWLATTAQDQAAVSLWCDAFLNENTSCAVRNALEKIGLNSERLPPWLRFVDKKSEALVRQRASDWLRDWPTFESGQSRRKTAMSMAIFPDEDQISDQEIRWRQTGIATQDTQDRVRTNPTMFATDGRFLETSGPYKAFKDLVDFYLAWKPLFAALRSSLENILIEISVVDIMRPDAFSMTEGYQAIDTSNVADYCGLINVLLIAAPLLSRSHKGAFIHTEHALSLASTLKHVLSLEFPFDAQGCLRLVRSCMRIEPKRVTEALPEESVSLSASGIERVVRIEWGRTRQLLKMSRSEFQLMCAQLIERQAPLPLNADMLSDPRRAVEQSFAWPKSTLGTVVEIILMAATRVRQPASFGCLDALFAEPQLLRTRLVRNAVLALTIETAARRHSLALVAPKARFKRQLPDVRWFTCYLSSTQETTMRAGLFEPSLAVALLSNSNVLALLLHNQGVQLWQQDTVSGQVLNAAFTDVISRAKATQIQILDRLRYDPKSNRLDLALPSDGISMGPAFPPDLKLLDAFEFFVLIDVLTYSVLSEPKELSALFSS